MSSSSALLATQARPKNYFPFCYLRVRERRVHALLGVLGLRHSSVVNVSPIIISIDKEKRVHAAGGIKSVSLVSRERQPDNHHINLTKLTIITPDRQA
jgi:hypothetical protein